MAAAAALGIIMLLERRWTSGAFYVIAAIATPFLFRHLSDTMRSEQFFTAGIPVFESGNITNTSLSIPFWIALLMLILFPILNKVGERIKSPKGCDNNTIPSSCRCNRFLFRCSGRCRL